MSAQLLKVRMALLAGLALVLACLVGPAEAGPNKPKPPPKARPAEPEPQKVSNAQLREALHVLRVTKKTLQGADHDYGGHRVNALKAITAAEKQLKLALESQTKNRKPANPGKGGGAPANPRRGEPEPQDISNLQLRESIVILKKTVELLEGANHDYGGHRVQAIKDLNGAIEQLHLALRYERKNGEK
jgi:hypothetical protein